MEEIIVTETTYVRDVHEIICGYKLPLQDHMQSLPVSAHQISSLFGNIEDIRDFHRYGGEGLLRGRGEGLEGTRNGQGEDDRDSTASESSSMDISKRIIH